MKVAIVVLIGLGLLAALAAAVLVSGMALPATQAAKPVELEAEVLIAAKALPLMSVVDASAVTTKKVKRTAVPEGALSDPVQVVGKVLTVPMVEGEAFNKTSFARDGSGLHLASALPPGKRAVSVQLADHTGMVGLLYPGSVVDVMVSMQLPKKNGRDGETVSRTLIQGVQVLAVGFESVTNEDRERGQTGAPVSTSLAAAKGDQRIVTLLVTPTQAQALQLAMQKGTLSLTMRNPLDQASIASAATGMKELSGDIDTAPAVSALAEGLTSLRERWGLALAKAAAAQPAAAAAGGDPFATPAPAAAPAPQWETLILRGAATEVRKFPMPPAGAEPVSSAAIR